MAIVSSDNVKTAMDLNQILGKTISSDQTELQASQQYLEQLAQTNLPEFLKSLSEALSNVNNDSDTRMAAALQLKNHLTSKDVELRLQVQQRWLSFSEDIRNCIKQNVVNALGIENSRPSSAAQCLAYIGVIELPHNLWPDLIPILTENVTNPNSTEMTKESTLEAIGCLCRDIEPEILVSQSNSILTTIVHGMRKDEPSNQVKLAATNALRSLLEFTKANFDKDSERHIIMQVVCEAAQCSEVKVREAALQCLVKIMSLYYKYMEHYMGPALFAIAMETMKNERVDREITHTHSGDEYCTDVCDEEVDLSIEGSSDSGKGGSDIVNANSEVPSHDHQIDDDQIILYQFEIPQYLCGRLIGLGGRFVALIKRNTNTVVIINRLHYASDMKICTLKGTKSEIKDALKMIRNRFPICDYPNVTLQQINLINPTQTCPVPQTCQLQLPNGISCDVILSSMVSAGHFFLQQPTHPTYPSLIRLDQYMSATYSQLNTPLLPNIRSGMICAVPIMGGWFRAVVTKVHDNEECDVMFVDYGGYSRLPVSSLRQIRYDFMSLPFQATECYLANVAPIDCESGWSSEANALFEELAQGQILNACIVAYADNGVPLVHLYKVQGVSNVFINQELVNQCHAQWVDLSA